MARLIPKNFAIFCKEDKMKMILFEVTNKLLTYIIKKSNKYVIMESSSKKRIFKRTV